MSINKSAEQLRILADKLERLPDILERFMGALFEIEDKILDPEPSSIIIMVHKMIAERSLSVAFSLIRAGSKEAKIPEGEVKAMIVKMKKDFDESVEAHVDRFIATWEKQK